MYIDNYDQIILDEDDLCDLYMQDHTRSFKNCLVSFDINSTLDIENKPEISKYQDIDLSIEDFDKECQNTWYMPDIYKNFDIVTWLLDQCETNIELERVGQELILYDERNLFPLLRYLKYLVDTLREHELVWGVGRGSSVASYVLYLIGVHKINSISYELDINEFLH